MSRLRKALRLSKAGQVYEGGVCQAQVPGYQGAWAKFATKQTKRGEVPDYKVPLKWVDDAPGDPEDGSGHWERLR